MKPRPDPSLREDATATVPLCANAPCVVARAPRPEVRART